MIIRLGRGLLLGIILALSTGLVQAQVSTNFDVHWWNLSGQGGTRQSTNYRIDSDLGYIGGVAVSTNQLVEVGYVHGIANSTGEDHSIYMPFVLSDSK